MILFSEKSDDVCVRETRKETETRKREKEFQWTLRIDDGVQSEEPQEKKKRELKKRKRKRKQKEMFQWPLWIGGRVSSEELEREKETATRQREERDEEKEILFCFLFILIFNVVVHVRTLSIVHSQRSLSRINE